MTKEELVNHVIDSFWLDLAYDEENRDILSEKGFDQLLQEAEKQRTIDPLPDKEDTSLWFKNFKKLKIVRVLDGLDLDKASRDYADWDVKPIVGQFQEDKFAVVRDRAKWRRDNLDSITWRCSAAIDRIIGYYNSKSETEKSERCEWATLLALYHSELCASASEEVSFGWARRQAFVLKNEAVGLKIFRWIANHNVSRGYNHLHNSLLAVKGLDYAVDAFDCETLSRELVDQQEKDNIDILLHRLIYMPAILTLAQGLGDLQRYSERRYYLNKGKTKLKEITSDCCNRLSPTEKRGLGYWNRFFSLHLSLTEIGRGFVAHEINNPDPKSDMNSMPPRTKSLFKQEETQHAELRVRDDFAGGLALGKETLQDWPKTTAWLLRWHSAEVSRFIPSLHATAEFLGNILKLVKKSPGNPEARISSMTKVMEIAINVLIETRRFMEFLTSGRGLSKFESERLKSLLDPTVFPRDMDRPQIWRSGSHLLGCLNILDQVFKLVNDSRYSDDMQELGKWRQDLGNALDWTKGKGAAKIAANQFRSEIEHFKLFPYKTPSCRFCANSKSIAPCDDDCVERSMNDASADRKVAKYGTYKQAMDSQQKRFLDYLKSRTAKERIYRPGEPAVTSPNFELISLRRWNSFSPNLGSRAAASVGGGYLIRFWVKDRYIGIAVDPGYNFLENLFNEGFTIADIDIIVVTHAHPDHTENLTNFFTLLFERNKRMADEEIEVGTDDNAPRDHRVFLLLTEGVFERYESMLPETKTYIRDVVVLKASEWRGSEASGAPVRVWTDKGNCCIELDSDMRTGTVKQKDCAAVILAKRAWHDDLTGHDSIGIVVKYWGEDNQLNIIGIMGDSKYHRELYLDYKDCSVLVAHLGSLISKAYYKEEEKRKHIPKEAYVRMIQQEDHLYLPGLTRLICDLANQNDNKDFPLLVLSEFGEELRGGLRKDLAKRLGSKELNNKLLPIVPADVGLRIDIEKKYIFCSICHCYLPWDVITAESVLPHEEALGFVCQDCHLLREGELPNLLEEWCTTGRPVIPLRSKSKH